MAQDTSPGVSINKYNSVWVSHSSIADFLKCPRLYFLRNVYKNEKGRKINIASPSLSLGIAVHETLEGLSKYKTEQEEKESKERGRNMIIRVANNPGLLARKTVKLPPTRNGMPPNFFLSAEENIILNGKIDWLEYIESDDSIRVIDFKTGKNEEKDGSLQLPIYLLLLNNLQKRKVSGVAYWYLDRDIEPVSVKLPDYKEAFNDVLCIAREIKNAREQKEFNCPKGVGGCFACRPFEKILRGEAEYIGIGGYGQEMYIV